MFHENVQTMLDTDQSAERLGIEGLYADEGKAGAQLRVVRDMANGHGVAQGGFTFALADYAFACAANSVVEDIATIEASISYLSPAFVGDLLLAEANVLFADSKRVVVDVTVRVDDRVVALFRGAGRKLTPIRD